MSQVTPAPHRTVRRRRRAGALAASLALASGAALVAAPAALATFPGANGKIAFARGGDVWTVNPDGTGERRVTSGPHVDVAPDWSPDGKELLFERLSLPPAAPSSHVYRIKADGTGLTWVTANGHEPAWFRDGKRIAFTRDTADGRDLYLANRDGSGQRLMEVGLPSLHEPDPSPVSDFVLVTNLDNNLNSTLLASSPGVGGMSWDLPDPDFYDGHAGSWSPDGRRIAFYQGTGPLYSQEDPDPKLGLAVMDVEGTNVRVITHGLSGVFSPDGTRIAYNAGSELRVIKTDGTGMRTIATVGANPDWQPIPRFTTQEAPAAAPEAAPAPPETETVTVTVEAPPSPPEAPATCAVPRQQLSFTARASKRIRSGARIRVTADLRGERPRVRLSRGFQLERLSSRG